MKNRAQGSFLVSETILNDLLDELTLEAKKNPKLLVSIFKLEQLKESFGSSSRLQSRSMNQQSRRFFFVMVESVSAWSCFVAFYFFLGLHLPFLIVSILLLLLVFSNYSKRLIEFGSRRMGQTLEVEKNALKASEQYFREVFENLPIGVIKLNSRFEITTMNPAYLRMLEYSAEELKTKSMLDITHPEDRRISAISANHTFEGRTLVQFEKRYLSKSGKVVWARVSSYAMNLALPEAERYCISVIEDVTSKKISESELL